MQLPTDPLGRTRIERGTPVVALTADIQSMDGADTLVAELIRNFTDRVRSESGSVVFAAWRVVAEPSRFFVYEEYENDEAFQLHLASAHTVAFNDALAPHVVGGGSVLTRLAVL